MNNWIRGTLIGMIMVLTILVGNCWYANRNVSPDGKTGKVERGKDFHRYYSAGRTYLETGDPFDMYDVEKTGKLFKYLPIFGILISLFSMLPFQLALAVWQSLHVFGLATSLYMWFRLFERRYHPPGWF